MIAIRLYSSQSISSLISLSVPKCPNRNPELSCKNSVPPSIAIPNVVRCAMFLARTDLLICNVAIVPISLITSTLSFPTSAPTFLRATSKGTFILVE